MPRFVVDVLGTFSGPLSLRFDVEAEDEAEAETMVRPAIRQAQAQLADWIHRQVRLAVPTDHGLCSIELGKFTSEMPHSQAKVFDPGRDRYPSRLEPQ